jgi:hypothetical protein
MSNLAATWDVLMFPLDAMSTQMINPRWIGSAKKKQTYPVPVGISYFGGRSYY